MNTDLKQSIRLAAIRLGIAYVAILIVVSSGAIYLNHVHQGRMAESFGRSIRNSLIIRDLRESISILNPSIGESFDAISFSSLNEEIIFALPNEGAEAKTKNSVWTSKMSIPIFTSSSSTEAVGVLNFYYKWTSPLWWSFSIWALFLASSVLVFRRIRFTIEKRHQEILRSKELEIVGDIAQQVSHDIRSPLSALNMIVTRLEGVQEDQREIIRKASKRINDIANDLLQRSLSNTVLPNPSSHSITVTKQATNISLLLESLIAEKKTVLTHNTNIEIKLDIGDSSQAICSVDEKELARVLSNLINNACEAFDGSGVITLGLRTYQEKNIAITVRDNGRGIPEDLLPHLGKEKVSHGKKGSESGSGIGLFHARSTIESMGGHLSIQSKVGVGTMVMIVLPQIVTT